MKSFISLEEAVDILNINTQNLDVIEINLLEAVGKILAENVYATINNPPFNKSAMDGYAIISEDTLNKNAKLEIIDEVFAGYASEKKIKNGTAIRIMTGAPIPEGANAVIKQEDVVKEENFINVKKVLKENDNICFKGEDIKKDQLLVKKGKKLDYADIGIISSSGIETIKVYRSPKVAFISTGDEVLDVNEQLKKGKIYNSNKYSILSRIKELGYEIVYINHENDSYEEIGNKIKEASKVADLIITTGGASVGEKDLIKEAIGSIDGEKLFWKILIKPGSAVLCSKFNEKLIISLSGNPTAALTTFELLVKTSLEKLSGKENIEIIREKAILKNDFLKKSKQRRFLRGYTMANENGQQVFITQVKSGNGILSSALNSNCLIEIESGNNGLEEGEIVTIIKF